MTEERKIEYVTGDATQPLRGPYGKGIRLIAHIVNDEGRWGSGFVVALSQRNKNPEDCYRKWFREGIYESAPFELGQVQTAQYTGPDVHVVNMIAQRGVRHSASAPRAVDYDALRDCLHELAADAIRWRAATGIKPSIHMPRIGCGLGGGDWATVEELIDAILIEVFGFQVVVYDLPQRNEGDS